MEITRYLARIGFTGDAATDWPTLATLQRLHLHSIPYENLDVLLGRTTGPDPAAAYHKIVERGRGGWCYEMNGVFGWALQALGFRVTRLASGVMRSTSGDTGIGNHLVLRVDLDDGPVLADVGLGGGALSPLRLVDGPLVSDGLAFRLEALEGGWWRFHNHAGLMPPDFDFHPDCVDEALLAATCHRLQTDPDSIFVRNLICMRFADDGRRLLLGRVLKHWTPTGSRDRLLDSPDELIDVLKRDFGIDEPEAAALWPSICARHEAMCASQATEDGV